MLMLEWYCRLWLAMMSPAWNWPAPRSATMAPTGEDEVAATDMPRQDSARWRGLYVAASDGRRK